MATLIYTEPMLSALKNKLRGYFVRNRALALTYHSIRKQPLPFSVWTHIAVEQFEEQIAYLASNFRCVSLSKLLTEIEHGKIYPYTVAVTFDDGFRDNVITAFPILQRYSVPATIFLASGFVGSNQPLWPEQVSSILALTKNDLLVFLGKQYSLSNNIQKSVAYSQLTHVFKNLSPAVIPQHIETLRDNAGITQDQLHSSNWYKDLCGMDWSEARQLRDSGLVDFGAHTVSHRCLSALTSAEAEYEICESKRVLEQHLGPISFFAYPYGRPYFNDSHREMGVRAGYRAIFTTDEHTIEPLTDPYAMPRAGIGADTSFEDFKYMLHGGIARNNNG